MTIHQKCQVMAERRKTAQAIGTGLFLLFCWAVHEAAKEPPQPAAYATDDYGSIRCSGPYGHMTCHDRTGQ